MRPLVLQVALQFLTATEVMSEEQKIAICKRSVSQIHAKLRSAPCQWRDYLELARSVMALIDTTTLMRQTSRVAEQTRLITVLQQLSEADDDGGVVLDISTWCSTQWLLHCQQDPQNVAALSGIGRIWVARAQPALFRTHRAEISSSSSDDGSRLSMISIASSEEERQSLAVAAEAERRVGGADYVEARGCLHPATEYLDRAVAAAQVQQSLSGDLLITAAEAHLSLGNTSSPRRNEPSFQRALQLLRMAAGIPGVRLSRDLQRYVDEYDRLEG